MVQHQKIGLPQRRNENTNLLMFRDQRQAGILQQANARHVRSRMKGSSAFVTAICVLVLSSSSIAWPLTDGNGTALLDLARKLDANALSKSDKQLAIEKYKEALHMFQNASDNRGVFAAANNIGILFAQLGDYKTALAYFETARRALDAISPPPFEEKFKILHNMAVFYRKLGFYTRSSNDLEKALELANDLNNTSFLRQVHYSIGQTYFETGRYGAALDSYRKALELATSSGDKPGRASAHFGIAQVYSAWGEYRKSEREYAKALSLCNELGSEAKTCEAAVYNDQGLLWEGFGRYDMAFDYFEKSLTIARETGAPAGTALVNLARVQQFEEKYENALTNYMEALKEYERAGNWPDSTHVAKLISYLYLDMCEAEDVCHMDKAEAFAKASGVWVALGRLELVKQNYGAAQDYYEKALSHAEQRDDSDGLFLCCTALGSMHEALGAWDKAESYYSRAIEHLEEIRAALSPSQRVNFFHVKVGGFLRIAPYKGLARVHMKAGHHEKAFSASEYTKARVFAEELSRRLRPGALGIPNEMLTSDSDLNERLSALLKQKQTQLMAENFEALAQIKAEIDITRKELSEHIAMLRKRFPAYAAVRYPLPMRLEDTLVEKDEWTISYDVSQSGVIAYLAQGKKLIMCHFEPISGGSLEGLVRKFREPLEIGTNDDLKQKLEAFDFCSGKRLSDRLLRDILTALPAGSPVLIVPDGPLGVVPFEMLTLSASGRISHDSAFPQIAGAEFFGDRNPVRYCQSVTALSLTRIQKRLKPYGDSLLVMADPVFDPGDDRVGKARIPRAELPLMAGQLTSPKVDLTRLELTGQLAKTLAALYPGKASVYTGLEASKNTLLEKIAPTLEKFGKIVFATHGFFGRDFPGSPDPVLVLPLVPQGTDGLLSMNDIMGLHINADVVALTACNTGLGRHVSGEGTMAVGRAFQCAGARSVLMTLWSVAESPSVDLTSAFFQQIQKGKSKLRGLQFARDRVRNTGFDHPFFWAGFILVGEAD